MREGIPVLHRSCGVVSGRCKRDIVLTEISPFLGFLGGPWSAWIIPCSPFVHRLQRPLNLVDSIHEMEPGDTFWGPRETFLHCVPRLEAVATLFVHWYMNFWVVEEGFELNLVARDGPSDPMGSVWQGHVGVWVCLFKTCMWDWEADVHVWDGVFIIWEAEGKQRLSVIIVKIMGSGVVRGVMWRVSGKIGRLPAIVECSPAPSLFQEMPL